MTIASYTEFYRDDVARLVEKFHREKLDYFCHAYDPSVVDETIRRFTAEPLNRLYLLLNDNKCVGLLAGHEVRSEFNTERFFQEVLWYIEQPYGRYAKSLIEGVTKILSDDGFDLMIMSVLENPRAYKIENLFRSFGFKKLETHYMRTL